MEKIKELRQRTGAGMVDCKKALDESNGDIDKAIEILRKRGIVKAGKRSDRDADEGIIQVSTNSDNTEAYIIEVNTETDFVARNEKFQDFVQSALKVIEDKKPSNLDEFFALSMESGNVKETMETLSGVIGEKIDIKRFDIVTGASVAKYTHMNGRIGVLVALDVEGKVDLATDIAMHIAAINPKYILPEEIPSEEIEKEKEIYKEQLLKEGKPENIIEKILEGKIGKYYSNVCLVKQEYFKDDKQKVENVLGDTKVIKFVRYSL